MRTVSRSRAVAAAIVTPMLMLGLSACGGDDKTPASAEVTTSDDPTDAPSDEPTEDATDEPTEPTEGDEVDDPGQVFVDMQKAMQEAGTTRVAMDLGMGSAKGQMSYGTGTPEMALTMDLGQQGLTGIEMRYVDGEMYMAMPGITPTGKFFKFDEGSTTLGPFVDQMRSMTPDASAELMRKSVREMTDAGKEPIDGEETTHYVLTVDTKSAADLAGDAGASEDDLAGMPKTLEYDMWVTSDNLMRRIVMNVMGTSMQMDYTDWGKPVDIKAPAAKDVIEAPAGL